MMLWFFIIGYLGRKSLMIFPGCRPWLQVPQRWALLAGASDAALLGMVGGPGSFMDRP